MGDCPSIGHRKAPRSAFRFWVIASESVIFSPPAQCGRAARGARERCAATFRETMTASDGSADATRAKKGSGQRHVAPEVPLKRIASLRPQTAPCVAARFGWARAYTSRERRCAISAPSRIAASTKTRPRSVRATISDLPASASPEGGVCHGSPTEISANAPVWSEHMRQRQRLSDWRIPPHPFA